MRTVSRTELESDGGLSGILSVRSFSKKHMSRRISFEELRWIKMYFLKLIFRFPPITLDLNVPKD